MRARGQVTIAVLCLLSSGWDLLRAPDSDVERGNRAFSRADYEEARKAYGAALERRGADARILYDLGTAMYKLAERAEQDEARAELFAKAEEALREAARSDDAQLAALAWYNLGNVWFRQGRYEDAASAYKDALRANPEHDDARYNMELALRHLRERGARQGMPQGGPNQPRPGQPGNGQSGPGQPGTEAQPGQSGQGSPQPGEEPPGGNAQGAPDSQSPDSPSRNEPSSEAGQMGQAGQAGQSGQENPESSERKGSGAELPEAPERGQGNASGTSDSSGDDKGPAQGSMSRSGPTNEDDKGQKPAETPGPDARSQEQTDKRGASAGSNEAPDGQPREGQGQSTTDRKLDALERMSRDLYRQKLREGAPRPRYRARTKDW